MTTISGDRLGAEERSAPLALTSAHLFGVHRQHSGRSDARPVQPQHQVGRIRSVFIAAFSPAKLGMETNAG